MLALSLKAKLLHAGKKLCKKRLKLVRKFLATAGATKRPTMFSDDQAYNKG